MNKLETLLKKIEDWTYTVGFIGFGYVGLPLIGTFHQQEMPAIDYDIDDKRVQNLKNGVSYIRHLGTEITEALANSDKSDATTDFSRLNEADAILMCVPTPLDHNREPDMSMCIVDTIDTSGRVMTKNDTHTYKS